MMERGGEWTSVARSLPSDASRAELVGRLWSPEAEGPVLVRVLGDGLHDLSSVAATCSQLLNLDDPVDAIRRSGPLPRMASLADVLANSVAASRDTRAPWLLAPCDLQPVKASGVTFVASLLERVIEEQAHGDPRRADALRASMLSVVGSRLTDVRPGSANAQRLKEMLMEMGAWSQYLEVGIGPDPEIFTKCPPMAAVGTGSEVGILAGSEWNNPEPEVVLAVSHSGRIAGASLGNDVNLRDLEGRSALLLGKAKDNNASCAIGPFIRLFDDYFALDDVRRCDVSLEILGPDGFEFTCRGAMSAISRHPADLVAHAIGPHHQYPDGLMLFLGTMIAPTVDRFAPGKGFTHMIGDVVSVSTPVLGTLVNRVNHSDKTAPWTFGAVALMKNLARRGLL